MPPKCSCKHGNQSGKHALLASVKVSKVTVFLNETVFVQVKVRNPADCTSVTINGSLGAAQYLQFSSAPGRRKIIIEGIGRHSGCSESRTVEVTVLPADCCNIFPAIQVTKGGDSQDESLIDFAVPNFQELREAGAGAQEGLRYLWDFSHGPAQASERLDGRIARSFEGYLDSDSAWTLVHVKVTGYLPSGRTISASRTIVVWNDYFLAKLRGTIKPQVKYNFLAALNSDGILEAKATIKNLEGQPIRLRNKLIEFLVDDPAAERQFGPKALVDITIAETSQSEVDCSISNSLIPKGAFGFAVHFGGTVSSSPTPVRVSCYFEHRESLAKQVIANPLMSQLLHEMRNEPLHTNRKLFFKDHILEHLEKLKNKPPTQLSRTIFKNYVLQSASIQFRTLPILNGIVPVLPEGLMEGYGLAEGEKCFPDQEPAEDDLACQLTESTEWVHVPARIVNACKGDTILSPGGMGPIGVLLRALSPPQVYAHCGIMTKNYYEITNSTADQDWLAEKYHLAGIVGSEGIKPKFVKYVWPGTIVQSIGQAFEGGLELLKDPEGKDRDIHPFEYHGTAGQGVTIAEALVVKPEPILEAQQPGLRTLLHRVADTAKEIKSHYRFFSFSQGTISSGNTIYNAPDEGPGWWASKTVPTCCSSLIWAAMKKVTGPRIQLEGRDQITRPEELEAKDTSPAIGAAVDRWTNDGLYRYEEPNRLLAAKALHQSVQETVAKVLSADYGSVGGPFIDFFTDAMDDHADQVCNTFAFDWAGEDVRGDDPKDSDDWQSPGVGRAVSPDNILLWDAPQPRTGDVQTGIYGYSERAIYRPAYWEERKVSRWVRVKMKGTIACTVRAQSVPVPYANINVGGISAVCDDRGQFSQELPAGRYQITAGALSPDGLYYQGSLEVIVTRDQTTAVTINLSPPPDAFREMSIEGHVAMKDDEPWPARDVVSPRFPWAASGFFFGPYSPFDNTGLQRVTSFTKGFGGELRTELHLTMDLLDGGPIRVTWIAKFFEGDKETTHDLEQTKSGVFVVPKNESQLFSVHLDNSGFGGGDTADISLTFHNKTKP